MDNIIKKIINFNSNLNNGSDKQIQMKIVYGGSKEKIKITYKDFEYQFIKYENDEQYILYSDDKKYNCVSVIVSKEDHVAEIHGIGNYKNCIQHKSLLEKTNLGVGTLLLKITLKMLIKYKNKFGINKISLTDNSKKKCNNNNIILSQMLFLLTGNTWYSKYGFKPRELFS